MSKALIEEVKSASELLTTTAAAKEAIDTVFTALDRVTRNGDKVIIRGLGTFERKTRCERLGRNPRNGEAIPIPARSRLAFKDRTPA